MMKNIFVPKPSFENNNNNNEDNDGGGEEDNDEEEVDRINNNRIQRIVDGHGGNFSPLGPPPDASHNKSKSSTKSVEQSLKFWL